MRLIHLLYKELAYHVSRIIRLFRKPKPNHSIAQTESTPVAITENSSDVSTTATQPTNIKFNLSRKHIGLIILGLLLIGFTSVVGLILLTYTGWFGALPTKSELLNIQNNNASELYASDEKLIGKYFIENRSETTLESVAPCVVYALIATEDARFLEHKGVDVRAAARVFWKSLLLQKNESGGGSTISQQLAKNLFPRKRYQFLSLPINKLREMFIARRLEAAYSKKELLNLYLNTVPFSDNAYGIKVASNRFFDTTPDQLQPEQGAVLIGMLKGTSIYDPVRYPAQSLERRNVVLQQMQKYGYLEQAVLDSLIQLPLNLKYSKVQSRNQEVYFKEHIRLEANQILKELNEKEGTAYNLYTDGLKVYTTIDAKLQRYAEEAVTEQMAVLQKKFNNHWKGRKPWGSDATLERAIKNSARYKNMIAKGASKSTIEATFSKPIRMKVFDWTESDAIKEMSPIDSIRYYLAMLHAGFLAVEPSSGQIKAWVGGIDYRYFQYDHVKSERQVGSIFKPIVYAKALEKGISPCSYFQNVQVTYPKWENWQPRNSDGKYGGFYSMAGGLSKSINTITVEVLFQTGIEPVRKLAQQLGMKNSIPKGPSIALGAVDASLSEMVTVYSTFANRGKRVQPYSITKIEDRNGTVLYEIPKSKAVQVIKPQQADILNHMLRTVVDSGTARRVRTRFGIDGQIAGKTGTTQNQSDGWFIGYNPKLVAGAWVGAESPQVHFRSLSLGQGASTALPIWGAFMRKVYQDRAYRSIKNTQFTPLSENLKYELSCDPYISDEMLDLDLLLEESEEERPFDNLFRNRMRRDTFDFAEDLKDGIDPDELRDLQRRMKKIERKDERREVLKELWKEKLFGKKEKTAQGGN